MEAKLIMFACALSQKERQRGEMKSTSVAVSRGANFPLAAGLRYPADSLLLLVICVNGIKL